MKQQKEGKYIISFRYIFINSVYFSSINEKKFFLQCNDIIKVGAIEKKTVCVFERFNLIQIVFKVCLAKIENTNLIFEVILYSSENIALISIF